MLTKLGAYKTSVNYHFCQIKEKLNKNAVKYAGTVVSKCSGFLEMTFSKRSLKKPFLKSFFEKNFFSCQTAL